MMFVLAPVFGSKSKAVLWTLLQWFKVFSEVDR